MRSENTHDLVTASDWLSDTTWLYFVSPTRQWGISRVGWCCLVCHISLPFVRMTRNLRGEFRRPVLHSSSHLRGAAWEVHGGDINKSPQNCPFLEKRWQREPASCCWGREGTGCWNSCRSEKKATWKALETPFLAV